MSDYGALGKSEKRLIDKVLGMTEGYVLDFSNRTIDEYFEDEFGISIYAEKFSINGNSKANRLRSVLEDCSGSQSAEILRRLWGYRSTISTSAANLDPNIEKRRKDQFFSIIAKLEGDEGPLDISAFAAFEKSNALYELVNAIERDIRADKPQAALDRLHLFCMKRFRHLLTAREISISKDEPLNSLVGKYGKALKSDGNYSEMSLVFIRYSIAVFEKFNGIRNNHSLAHDNELLSVDEAKFIFDAVSAVLRFIKRIDKDFDT